MIQQPPGPKHVPGTLQVAFLRSTNRTKIVPLGLAARTRHHTPSHVSTHTHTHTWSLCSVAPMACVNKSDQFESNRFYYSIHTCTPSIFITRLCRPTDSIESSERYFENLTCRWLYSSSICRENLQAGRGGCIIIAIYIYI